MDTPEIPVSEAAHLFVGKTIAKIDGEACNNVEFLFTDGTRLALHIDCDGTGLPEVLVCTHCAEITADDDGDDVADDYVDASRVLGMMRGTPLSKARMALAEVTEDIMAAQRADEDVSVGTHMVAGQLANEVAVLEREEAKRR